MEGPASPRVDVPLPAESGIDPFWLVSAQEIAATMPPANTAAGPDGLAGKDLRAIPVVLLQVLLDILMLVRHLPVSLRNARTVFLPKLHGAESANQFRPITISSAIVR